MVAQFVRLKLTLMRNTFRRSVWQTIGFVIGSLYGLFVAVMLVGGIIVLGTDDAELAGTVIILGGSLAVAAWWLVPLFAFGVDSTLDPRRFVLYALTRRQLLSGMAAAGVISIPGFATVLVALGICFAWWRDPVALLVAVIGAGIAVATCIVGSRATTTALAPLLESRKYREVVTIAAFVPLIMIGPAMAWLAPKIGEGDSDGLRTAAEQIASVLGWTPLGAAWSRPAAVHDGAWLLALAHLVVALVTVAALWLIWGSSLERTLTAPPAAGGGGRGKGIGWFGRFPATPTGAVAARCLTYWVRDPRYAGSIAIIPLIPIILFVLGDGLGTGVFLALAPFAAWMFGYSIGFDISYDFTAFALHVSTGVRGLSDRWGRVIAVTSFGAPVILLFTLASCGVAGRWNALPAVLGMSAGLFLGSLGIASVSSAWFVIPVPKPGESPFKQPQGAAMATMAGQMATLGIVILISLPVLILGILALVLPSALLGWIAAVVGFGGGALVMILGVRQGAKIYDRRAPDMLQKLLSFA